MKIKSLLLVLVLVLFTVFSAQAADVKLAWDASKDSTVTGYKLYYGIASRTYGTPVDAGHTTEFTLLGVAEGKNVYFAVTAYDANKNESVFSEECTGYSLTPNAGIGGTITPNKTVIVDKNLTKTFTITPNAGYYIGNVAVDWVNQGPITSYTFAGVTSNHMITSTYSIVLKPIINLRVTE